MGIFLIMVGFAVNAVCGIVIVIKAFKVSAGWGLAVLFLPFAGLVFVINHWQDTKNPFLGGLAASLLMLLGVGMIAASAKEEATKMAEERRAEIVREEEAPRPATYASVAATPASYQPPRSSYVPSYNPSPAVALTPPPATDTQPAEDEWARRKPVYEQVYVDRATLEFYSEKCRKRPENVYRIPRTVAIAQGMTEAKCR